MNSCVYISLNYRFSHDVPFKINARIMKFIANEIMIMFLGFLALLGFLILILKTLMFDL